ncbi:MAG: hypothetical protein AAGJ81_05285 [Verrucomicrobiota bacterium]
MDRESIEEIYDRAVILIDSGQSGLVASYLYDISDNVIQGLVRALGDRRQYHEVPGMIDFYDFISSVSFRGGSESKILRLRTINVTEEALVELTGVSLEPEWTTERKLAEFREYLARSEEESAEYPEQTFQEPVTDSLPSPTDAEREAAVETDVAPETDRAKDRYVWVIGGIILLGAFFILFKVIRGKFMS